MIICIDFYGQLLIELISSTDGKIRAASIHLVADKSDRISIRPCKLLMPLEAMQPVHGDVASAAMVTRNSSTHAATPAAAKLSSAPMSYRPKRNTAVIGEIHRKNITALK